VVSSLQAFRPKLCMRLASLPFVFHAPLFPPPWYDHLSNLWRRVQTIKFLIMQLFSVFSPLVPNISLSTVFSTILTLYYSPNVKDEVPVAAI
jgi:hypothetical protein